MDNNNKVILIVDSINAELGYKPDLSITKIMDLFDNLSNMTEDELEHNFNNYMVEGLC